MASAWTGPHARKSRIQLAFSRGARIGTSPPYKPMLDLILAWMRLWKQACWEAACGTGKYPDNCGTFGAIARTLYGKSPAPAGACQTPHRAGKIRHRKSSQKGSAMPSDDWATRHPELVHWLHQADDELVGYAPVDDLPTPVAVFPERLLPFFVVITPSVGRQGQLRHR